MKKTTHKTTMLRVILNRDEFKKAIGIPAKFRMIDVCIEDDDLYNLGNSSFACIEAVQMSTEELKERKHYLVAT